MKKTIRFLMHQYYRWLAQPKNVVLFILLVLIRKVVVTKLNNVSCITNTPLQIFESSIAVGNSGLILLFLPLFFIVLMSDFPFLDTNIYFVLPRIGRKEWSITQIAFVYLSSLTYVIFIIFSTILQTIFRSFSFNGWSLVVTDFAQTYWIGELIPMNLYNQMTPFQAFLLTYILLFLFISLGASVQLLGCVLGRKKVTTIVWIVIVMVGMATVALKSKFEWFLPSAHSILWIHFDKYYREENFPVFISICMLLCFGIGLNILSYIKMKKTDYNILREG